MITTASMKVALLTKDRQSSNDATGDEEKATRMPILVLIKHCRPLLQYWLTIRPFCALLARALQFSPERVGRWESSCFIRPEVVTAATSSILKQYISKHATFQDLRHAMNATFRDVLLPKYLAAARFNFHRIFGHSAATGAMYGVRFFGGDSRGKVLDTTLSAAVFGAYVAHLQGASAEGSGLSSDADSNEDDSHEHDDHEDHDTLDAGAESAEPADGSNTDDGDDDYTDDHNTVDAGAESAEPADGSNNDDDDDDDHDDHNTVDARAGSDAASYAPPAAAAAAARKSLAGQVAEPSTATTTAAEPADGSNNDDDDDDDHDDHNTVDARAGSDAASYAPPAAAAAAARKSLAGQVAEPSTATTTAAETAEPRKRRSCDEDDVNTTSNCLASNNNESTAAAASSADTTSAGELPLQCRAIGYTKYRTVAQRQFAHAVAHGRNNVLAVLPTGSGKTMPITMQLLNEGTLSLVVVPLVAVRNDLLRRLRSQAQRLALPKSAVASWPAGERNAQTWDEVVSQRTRLLVLSAEQATTATFLRSVQGKPIHLAFFDEASLYLSSAFRHNLQQVPTMMRALLQCPFVIITGTLPVEEEERLLRSFFAFDSCEVIRAPSVQPNLVHEVRNCDGRVNAAHIDQLMPQSIADATSRAIVYCLSLQQCADLCKQFNALRPAAAAVYTGALSDEEKADAFANWNSGKTPVMFATAAFVYGVDNSLCDTVVCIDGAYSLESYVQSCGRAARTPTKMGRCFMLLSQVSQQHRCLHPQWVTAFASTKQCRQQQLSVALDPSCLRLPFQCSLCDHCRSNPNVSMPTSTDLAAFTNQVKQYRYGSGDTVRCLLRERALAKRTIKQNHTLLRTVARYADRGFCLSCLVLNKKKHARHSLHKCPIWARTGRCFTCTSNCKRGHCTQKQAIDNVLRTHNVCHTCLLPPGVYGLSLHAPGMGKHCPLKDSVLTACKALFANDMPWLRQHLPDVSVLQTLPSFVHWLAQRPLGGPTNAMTLIRNRLPENMLQ